MLVLLANHRRVSMLRARNATIRRLRILTSIIDPWLPKRNQGARARANSLRLRFAGADTNHMVGMLGSSCRRRNLIDFGGRRRWIQGKMAIERGN
jgi:hypothetical protein